MESIEKLTIESVSVAKNKQGQPITGQNQNGAWTLYNITASNDSRKFSAFDIKPEIGTTATFKIKTEQSDKTDRNGKPFVNHTILGYAGPVANIQTAPARPAPQTFTASTGQAGPTYATQRDIFVIEKKISDIGEAVENILARVETLERGPSFESINNETPF